MKFIKASQNHILQSTGPTNLWAALNRVARHLTTNTVQEDALALGFESVLTLAELWPPFFSTLIWGGLDDKLGRPPVPLLWPCFLQPYESDQLHHIPLLARANQRKSQPCRITQAIAEEQSG